MALSLALVPLMSALWPLVLVLLLLGVAQGVLDVGGNTLLVWVHRDRVGPYMNGLHFFYGLGASLAPIVVAQVLRIDGGFALAYWVLALLILPVFVWVLRLPSPPIRQVEEEGGSARQTRRLLVALIAIFFFLYVGAEVGYGGWIYTYAVTLRLLQETSAAYLVSVFWGALTAGRLLSVPLAAKVRPRSILIGALIGCLVSLCVILLGRGSPVSLWGGSIGLGFCMAPIFPTTLSMAERRVQITGKVTSWFFVGSSLGGMVLPWALGPLVEFVGPRSMMWTILADLLLAGGVFGMLIRHADAVETAAAGVETP
jgi:fucose permease